MDQRVQEIDSEADSDDQPDDGLDHVRSPYKRSQATAYPAITAKNKSPMTT
jgi:hypothetical protein